MERYTTSNANGRSHHEEREPALDHAAGILSTLGIIPVNKAQLSEITMTTSGMEWNEDAIKRVA